MTEKIAKEIGKFIDDNSWFDIYDTDGIVLCRTRENGCCGDEEYGDEDEEEAQRILKLVMAKFDGIISDIEFVDEWVHISVKSSKVGEYDLNDLPKGVKVSGHGSAEWMNCIIDEPYNKGKIPFFYMLKSGGIICAYSIDKIVKV